ncbi:hypothetical protein [Streptomyces yangpuensis]|uniref:hypothetical protein n=1 Tax=Streptomyces yangpuensis TaxID=1648182 RepID=UPI0035D83887
MRTTSLLAPAAAVTALLTLTACGSGENQSLGGIGSGTGTSAGSGTGTGGTTDGGPDEGTLENPTKNGGVNGNAPKDGTAFQKLPKAGTIAAAARFVNGFTKCAEITTTQAGYKYWDQDVARYGENFSVVERGSCDEGDTRIFMIKDMKKFQTAYKEDITKKASENRGSSTTGVVIGQDFTVGSTRSTAMAALIEPRAGLLTLNCHPEFKPPSGFRKEPALVDGCVLTDYRKS